MAQLEAFIKEWQITKSSLHMYIWFKKEIYSHLCDQTKSTDSQWSQGFSECFLRIFIWSMFFWCALRSDKICMYFQLEFEGSPFEIWKVWNSSEALMFSKSRKRIICSETIHLAKIIFKSMSSSIQNLLLSKAQL